MFNTFSNIKGLKFRAWVALKYAVILCLVVPIDLGHAAGDPKTAAKKPFKNEWSFKGPFGSFDRAELQRGFQVYKEVCAGCHSIKYLRYEKLAALGFNEAEIKAIAASAEVPGPLNDAGEATTKPGDPGDYFPTPYPNETAARAANNGAYPVDLSLITKARFNGPDYLYALLTGYVDPPADFSLIPGMSYNEYFEGRQIAMSSPLLEDMITYSDGTKASVQQMAKDVTVFLSWVAEPEMEERKQLGIKVLIFLGFFTSLLYILMRRAWRRVE